MAGASWSTRMAASMKVAGCPTRDRVMAMSATKMATLISENSERERLMAWEFINGNRMMARMEKCTMANGRKVTKTGTVSGREPKVTRTWVNGSRRRLMATVSTSGPTETSTRANGGTA